VVFLSICCYTGNPNHYLAYTILRQRKVWRYQSRKSKKDRHYNGQMKKDNRINS